MQQTKLIPFLAVAALGVAACGSSSSSSTSSTSSTSSSPAAAASATASTTASAAAAGAYGAGGSSAAGSATSQRTVVIATKHNKLGTILAYGPKKLTAYMFEADGHGASTCAGACAQAWPPVLGKATVAGAADSADLGTVKRADGRVQVTYKGHPLYGFVKDRDDEDAYGQGSHAFGAGWYVLTPGGSKIDTDKS